MKNITITVPDKVAKWARIWAARNNGSVSKLVGELLTERMNEETAYRASLKRYIGKPAVKLRAESTPYPKRDELYGR
jgi:hypothetical protein